MSLDWFKDKKHILWLVAGVIGFALIALYTKLLGAAAIHLVAFAFVGAIVYGLDFHFAKLLSTQRTQFGAAVLIAEIWGFISHAPFWMVTLLAFFDIVVLMFVFTLSAHVWPNEAIIRQRIDDVRHGRADPLESIREAAGVVGSSAREGPRATRDEFKRGRDHFGGPPRAA